MDRTELLKFLEKLKLPKNQFVVLSGGSLVLRGIREKTHDLDLSFSKELALNLDLYHSPRDTSGFYNPFPGVQSSDDMEKISHETIDGYLCETLESIIDLKKKLGRPKDMRDLKLIEEFLIHQVKIYGVYRHFKGNYYLVEDIIYHSETKEAMVAYRSLYGESRLWARPLAMFLGLVDHKKYPNTTQKYRFELQEKLDD